VSNVQLDDNIRICFDCWKRKGFSRRRKLESVGAETTSSGSPFQIRGPETLKVGLPTVDSRNFGTTRRLELTERSARRPCRSATRSSSQWYRGAVSCRTLYVSTAILYDTIRYAINTHALNITVRRN